MRKFLLELILGRGTTNELVMCLEGAVWCMTHDVAPTMKAFELSRIESMIDVLEGR